MTAHELARVGMRVLGLALLVAAATSSALTSVVHRVVWLDLDGDELRWLAGPLVQVALLGASGLVLVLRGGRLAGRLRIAGPMSREGVESGIRPGATAGELFAASATVLGAWMVVGTIEPAGRVLSSLTNVAGRRGVHSLTGLWNLQGRGLVEIALRLAGGLGLVVGPGANRAARAAPPAAPSGAAGAPMTSRDLGCVLLRLAGCVFLVLGAILVITFAVMTWIHGGSGGLDAVYTILAPVLLAVVGILLLRHADWIGATCTIGSDAEPCAAPPAAPDEGWSGVARRVGLVVVGLLACMDALTHLRTIARALLGGAQAASMSSLDAALVGFAAPEVDLVREGLLALAFVMAGVILILSPRRIGRWLRSTFLMPRSTDQREAS